LKKSANDTSPSAHTDSYYAASALPCPEFPTLNQDAEADVCIIGGGYTGLSSALHLAKKGLNAVVLEAEKVGWGASGRNGGHVGTGQRVSQSALEKKHGLETARQLWGLGLEAVDLVRQLIADYDINCDLKEGILHVAAKKSHVEYLKQETEVLRSVYGYEKISFIDKGELDHMVGAGGKYFAAQLDQSSLHLHPLKYAHGLAAAAKEAGARIFENSKVLGYEKGSTLTVRTARGNVKAKTIILACNGYLKKLAPEIAGCIMPINNFVLATEPLPEQLARELIRDDVAVQDSLFVINYWKLSADNRLVFGGGENYTSKFPNDIKSFVRKYMLRVYPQLESTAIDYAWGGTLAITLNRMPSFGTLDSNIYHAHGYSGHGIPTATLAGKVLADAIAGDAAKFNLIADLPSPRFPGGTLFRWPGLVAGMLFYSLMDKL